MPMIVDARSAARDRLDVATFEMSASPSIDAISDYLESAIESVVRLDVLMLCHRAPARSFTSAFVARELRVTNEIAERELAVLCARGLVAVTIGEDILYAYQPIDDERASLTDRIAEIIATRRPEICALLQAASQSR
jgi:hypothetical protein